MIPIYVPRGAAKEYGDYALNIYTGCPHKCWYCFAPNVLRCGREAFGKFVEPRMEIVAETRRQLERDTELRDKLIHLCFTCDPYPTGRDSSTTREIIKLLKEYGNHIQILTKGDGSRDLDLLDENDWYGVTLDGSEDADTSATRMQAVGAAAAQGIKTWVSFEPVLEPAKVLVYIQMWHELFDKVKIGKLNHFTTSTDWKAFGAEAVTLCEQLGVDYYIKDSLRKEMEA